MHNAVPFGSVKTFTVASACVAELWGLASLRAPGPWRLWIEHQLPSAPAHAHLYLTAASYPDAGHG